MRGHDMHLRLFNLIQTSPQKGKEASPSLFLPKEKVGKRFRVSCGRESLFLLLLILSSAVYPQNSIAQSNQEEQKLFQFARKALQDGLDELAATKLLAFLQQFPESEYREEALLDLARARLNQGRWLESLEILEQHVEKTSPAWKDSYLFLIAESQLKGELDAASIESYQRLLRDFPHSRHLQDARYGMARALLQKGQLDQAEALLKDLRKDGRHELRVRAALTLGILYYIQRDYDLSSQLLTQLARQEKNNSIGIQALYSLGEMELARGRKDQARQQFEAITKLQTGQAFAVIPQAYFRLGGIESMDQNHPGAAAMFEQAFRKSEDETLKLRSIDELVRIHLNPKHLRIESFVEKLGNWAKEHEKSPLGEKLLLQTGIFLHQAGKFEQAIARHEEFLDRYPDGALFDKAHFHLGWGYLELKRYDEALEEFQISSMQARSPQLKADALYKIGDTHFLRKEYAQAAKSYMEASNVSDSDRNSREQALFQAALSQLRAGEYARAQELHALHQKDFPRGKLAPQFLLLSGQAHRRQGNMPAVQKTYETFCAQHADSPEYPRALIEYAECLSSAGQHDQALSLAETFLEKFETHELGPRAMVLRGKILERGGKADLAIKNFEQVFQRFPKHSAAGEAQFWLGSYFDRTKNYARAQEHFELLLKNLPDHPLIPEALFFAARAAYKLGQKKEDPPRLLQQLVKNHPTSPWAFEGKFLYADILSEQGKFEESLTLFEDLVKPVPASSPGAPSAASPSPERLLEVHGRRGQCLRQLKRYDDALQAFQNIRDSKDADATLRNSAFVELGKTYEAMDKLEPAIENYLSPLYTLKPKPVAADGREREFFWICKGGLEAVRVFEGGKRWKEAAGILKRMIDTNLPCRKEAEERLKKIVEEHALSS
jgi:TolA-binding protein